MFFSAHERNSCSISYSPWGMKSLFMIPLVCFKDTRERSASNIDNGRIPKLKPSPEIRKQNSRGPTFRKLIQLLRPHWFSLSLSTVSLLGYTSVTLSIPRLFGALLDHGGGNCAVASDSQWKRNLSDSGVRPIPMLLGCIVLGGLLNTLRLSLLGRVAEDIANQLRTGGFSCLMHKTASFYDNPDNASSVLSERLINDSARIGSALSESLANGAKNCCQILGSFSIMLHLSPVLTLSILCTLPPMAYTTAMYGRLVKRFSSLQQQTRARLIAYATERLSSIQVVLSLNKESYECRSFQKLAVEYVRLGRSSAIGNASNTGVVQTVGYIVLLGVLTLGKAEVNRGKLTSGKLFSFILYTVYCGLGILGVSNAVLELYKVLGIAQGNEYLNQAPKAANDSSTTVSVELSQHDTQKSEKLNLVKFNSVTFFYPTRPDVMVHRALSFSIPRGKCTVVVGASGSGKTTLAKLLLGMYPPNKGSIQYDGARIVSSAAHDMEDKEQVEEFILASGVRRRVSYLPQEAPLFHTTIANNLLYGLDDASERTSNLHTGEDMVDIPESMMEAMHHAAQRAAAHDFIMQLPLQYNTVVGGESGRTLLSGGQKQRLILARCFIRKPELMILDEPTNGLDAQCIEAFHKTVRQLCSEPNRIDEQLPGQISNPPVTVLLFTHRMQTAVQLAQHLIILADGSVTYEGPHGKQSEDLLESLLR